MEKIIDKNNTANLAKLIMFLFLNYTIWCGIFIQFYYIHDIFNFMDTLQLHLTRAKITCIQVLLIILNSVVLFFLFAIFITKYKWKH